MSSPRQYLPLPVGQDWFIDRMKKIIPNANEKGICFGLAAMSMQAIFLNDLSLFNRRLELIQAIPEETFAQKIDELNKKRIEIIKQVKKEIGPARNTFIQKKIEEKMKAKLSKNERIRLDIPVFLQGVQLYQTPDLYQSLLEKGVEHTQNITRMFPLAAPKQLEKKGGISKCRDFSGAYTVDTLAQYFHLINQAAEANHIEVIQRPLVFVLVSIDHAITIGYHPAMHTWSFTDANQLPTTYISDPKELAGYVIKAFSTNRCAIFFTEIYAKEIDKSAWEPIFSKWENCSEWKAIHAITSGNAQLTNSNNVSWLYIAAKRGYVEIAKGLLENGANPNQVIQKTGGTPLFTAAQNGHLEIVKALLEKKADPNQAVSSGATPIHIAVWNGYTEVVKTLLEKKANPDYAAIDGTTPIFIAAQEGKLEMVELLLQHKADLGLKFKSTSKQLRQFAIGGNKLAKMDAFIKTKQPGAIDIFMTPKEMATVMGHHDIVERLELEEKKLAESATIKNRR